MRVYVVFRQKSGFGSDTVKKRIELATMPVPGVSLEAAGWTVERRGP